MNSENLQKEFGVQLQTANKNARNQWQKKYNLYYIQMKKTESLVHVDQ